MAQRLLLLAMLSFAAISCQFTETMVLNEDGSGKITAEVNMNEMMSFGGADMMDSVAKKIDTVISMKKFLEEKKDSISQLSAEEQQRLKKMEKFKIHINMDTETSEMVYDISTEFNSINEANDLLSGLGTAGNFMPKMGATTGEENKKEEPESDILGVKYSFENGIFKRDSYIKDKKLHSQQVDSLKNSEAFMSGVYYTLNYTFPKPIKKSSNADATYSLDRKTLTLKKSFIEYFKNPDILDLEVELEN